MSRFRSARPARLFAPTLVALVGTSAHAQPQLDLSHSWVRSLPQASGTGAQSYANGVAVFDSVDPPGPSLQVPGTVVVVGHADTDVMILAAAPPPTRGFVAFVAPDANPAGNWLRHFVGYPSPGSGSAACTGVSAAKPAAIGPPTTSQPNAFVSGWFSGTVTFQSTCAGGSHILTSYQGTRDAFITRVNRDLQCTEWVTTFGGAGTQEGLAVGVGPNWWADPPVNDPNNSVRHFTASWPYRFAVVGGYFNPGIEFTPGQPITGQGGDDAFVAVVGGSLGTGLPGALLAGLAIGGTGNERITALAVDPVDQAVVVAGYYSSAVVNFDPAGDESVFAPVPAGLNDIFVARYCFNCANFSAPCDQYELVLDWLYTTGSSGDDQALGVAVDVQGRAFVTGYRSDPVTGRDLWIAKIDQQPQCHCSNPNANCHDVTTVSAWGPPATGLIYAAAGDSIGRGITLDGLDRVIVTGQFAGTVDFDPTGNVDNKTSAGGLDLFLTRLIDLTPEIPGVVQYDGSFTIGGAYDEVGSAVAIEGLRSQRLAHAGWFGAPNSPSGYTVDFDPFAGVANRVGTGGADGFVSTLLPTIPPSIKTAVSLVLDASGFMDDYANPDWPKMLEALATQLPNPAITPHDEKLALSVVLYDFDVSDEPDNCADQILPWTVIRPSNAWAFAHRLANQPRRTIGPCKRSIADGLIAAHASQVGDRISACYRTILVVAAGENHRKQFDDDFTLQPARDYALTEDIPTEDVDVNRINAIAVRGDSDARDTFMAFTGPPDPQFGCTPSIQLQYLPTGPTPTPPPPDEFGYLVGSDDWPHEPYQPWHLGLALHTNGVITLPPNQREFMHPSWPAALQLMIRRSTRCPGDFDFDGDVEPNDMMQFMTAYMAGLPSADWNMDGGLVPNSCVINMDDVSTFYIAHGLGCCGS